MHEPGTLTYSDASRSSIFARANLEFDIVGGSGERNHVTDI